MSDLWYNSSLVCFSVNNRSLLYIGERCEQCGMQQSIQLCENGGVCKYDKSTSENKPVCSCPPGYNPLTNCATKTCDNYCKNGGKCTLNNDQWICSCSDLYGGNRCELPQQCKADICKNGGRLVLIYNLGFLCTLHVC